METKEEITLPKKEKKSIRKKMKGKTGKVFGDFKKFAFKGNIIDLAIAVIIGAAFGKIVSSLVEDIIMPCLGSLLGDTDFSDLGVVLKKGDPANGVADTVLRYGEFIQTIFEFFIIAISIFMIYKIVMRLKKLAERRNPPAPVVTAPEFTKTEQLLKDIKDILKKQSEHTKTE